MTNIANSSGQNSNWVDIVVQTIQEKASGIDQPEFKNAVIEATLSLIAHKDDIASLGIYGLTLFLQKLAIGDKTGAYVTFIETQATFKDLIDGQNNDAAAMIAAAKERASMEAKAISFAEDIAIAGARALIPFLLTLLI